MNRKSFGRIVFIFGIVLVLVLCIFFFTGKASAKDNNRKEVKEYITYEVESGDSLWTIAEEHFSSNYRDFNEYIEEVSEINHINRENILISGSVLVLPIYTYSD